MITVHTIAAFRPELKGLIRDIRVVWALEELGMPYERRVMDGPKREHKRPEYLALNPFGRVPTIQDGDFTLFESPAICTYLGDKAGRLIPPPGTRERALYDQWVSCVTTTLETWFGRFFWLDVFTAEKDRSPALRQEALTNIEALIRALDMQLASRTYLLGEEFTLADVQLGAALYSIRNTGVPENHPHVKSYLEKIHSRPAFQRALQVNGEF